MAVEFTPQSFDEENTTEVYQYSMPPIDVQSGDVRICLSQTRVDLNYYTDKYGPVCSSGEDSAPTGDFPSTVL